MTLPEFHSSGIPAIRDDEPVDTDLLVVPGALEAGKQNGDTEKGINALHPDFNLVYLHLIGIHDIRTLSGQYCLKPNDLVVLPENTFYLSENIHYCTGYFVHFKTEFIQPLLNGELFETVFPFFDIENQHVLNIDSEESRIVQHDFLDILSEHRQCSTEKNNLIRNYLYILLLHIRGIQKPFAHQPQSTSQTMRLARLFKSMLGKNFTEMHNVAQYADRLHVSPKHLTEVVKKTFGKTPRQMINDILLREARVLLQFTDMTVSEIAYRFHFQDHSHFCHFIRQHTGCSPLELRKKV